MPKQRVQLLNAATSTNSAPSAATAGVEVNSLGYGGRLPDSCIIALKSTAGSGSMSVTIKMWGYDSTVAVWMPLGTHPSDPTLKGIINGGVALGESATDLIRHCEILDLPKHLERIYAEITAIAGSSTAVSAWLIAEVP